MRVHGSNAGGGDPQGFNFDIGDMQGVDFDQIRSAGAI